MDGFNRNGRLSNRTLAASGIT